MYWCESVLTNNSSRLLRLRFNYKNRKICYNAILWLYEGANFNRRSAQSSSSREASIIIFFFFSFVDTLFVTIIIIFFFICFVKTISMLKRKMAKLYRGKRKRGMIYSNLLSFSLFSFLYYLHCFSLILRKSKIICTLVSLLLCIDSAHNIEYNMALSHCTVYYRIFSLCKCFCRIATLSFFDVNIV